MMTRRAGLALAAAVPVTLLRAGPAHASAEVPTVRTPPGFTPPPGATDTHVHVLPDPAAFPYWSGRAYTPPAAEPEALLALQDALHLDRVVIVTPSVYGTDNRATLEGMRRLGPERARGIAVIGPDAQPAELDAMHAQGIRGVRVNLEQAGEFDPAALARRLGGVMAQLAGRPWHLQVYSRLAVIAPLHDQLAALPLPVVFDHFAGAQAALGMGQPGFDAVLDLVRSGRAYVKISGAYRASTAPGWTDVAPLARALVAANPDRIVWGSDWPHPDSAPMPGRKPTDLAPAQDVDDGRLFNLLAEWVPDEATRSKILVANPARLYGYG
ncbi:MAG: amidohydrolase family protein [Janthinobacterium lividum]